MFKLEFPSNNKSLALAIGKALVSYGSSVVTHTVDDHAKNLAGADITSDSAVAVLPGKEGLTLDDAAIADLESQTAVKLNDSAAGLSESQAELADETQVPETAEHAAEGVPTVDKNGVPPNWSYCAKAAKPFYATGKYAGQWKKGTKVEQADYDKWYLAAKADAVAAHPANNTTEQAGEFDTSNAFGNTGGTPAADTSAPVGIGGFIKWTSEMQTANILTQADITEAYTMLGLTQASISPIEPNAQTNILSLFSFLSSKVPV